MFVEEVPVLVTMHQFLYSCPHLHPSVLLLPLWGVQGCPGTFSYKIYRYSFSDSVLTLPNQFPALYLMAHLLQK